MSTSLKILIVEDEVLIAEHLTQIILKNFNFSIKQVHNLETAELFLNEFQPDLVFLDIRLDKKSEGIELAKIINNNFLIPFIYITGFSDDLTMQKAVETKPFSFITKPFKEADIKAAILLAVNFIQSDRHNEIIVKEGSTSFRLPINQILYVISKINYIEIYTKNKYFLVRHSLEWFLSYVNNEKFIRIHRSCVVNFTAITSFTHDEVVINNVQLPLSRLNRPALLDKLK